MKKRVRGNRLGRSLAHRESLHRNLISSLFLYGKIKTTLTRAKVVRPQAEKLITKAKSGGETNLGAVRGFFYHPQVAEKLIGEIAPRFQKRSGGYLRIIKLGPRSGDAVEMAQVELLIDEPEDNQTQES